jgi:hypothetical protein
LRCSDQSRDDRDQPGPRGDAKPCCGLAMKRLFVGGLAISALLVAACGGANAAVTSTATADQTVPAATSDVTAAPLVVQTSIPTAVPTAQPTAQPTARPTARPTPRPTARPTPRPTPPPSTCGAPPNPWGYNFCGGNVINSPQSTFCGYFNCIPSFWTSTNGYVDECTDGMYSHSGGVSGACSHHGGERRPLYS